MLEVDLLKDLAELEHEKACELRVDHRERDGRVFVTKLGERLDVRPVADRHVLRNLDRKLNREKELFGGTREDRQSARVALERVLHVLLDLADASFDVLAVAVATERFADPPELVLQVHAQSITLHLVAPCGVEVQGEKRSLTLL